MAVVGEGALEFTADTSLLQDILDALDLRDVLVPQQLNGAVVKVHMPPRVITKYQRNGMAQAFWCRLLARKFHYHKACICLRSSR